MSENGRNAVDITIASHPYNFDITLAHGASFVDKVPPLFAIIDSDASQIEFEFSTDGGLEAVQSTLFTEDGKKIWTGVVDGPTNASFKKPSGSQLKIIFEKLPGNMLEDVNVRAKNGVMPFIATDVSVVLIKKPTAPSSLRKKTSSDFQ
jgi:hypothetical protein